MFAGRRSGIIQDLKNGKIRKRIATGAAPVERDYVAMVGTGNRLVMVHGGSRAGDVAVIDATSGKVKRFAGQRCAP